MTTGKNLLFVINGYEEGRLIELNEEINQVGRSEDIERDGKKNNIILAYDDKISRVHALIEFKGDTMTVTDLGSKYGIKVNNVTIVGTKMLVPMDVLTLGETLLMVCDSDKPKPLLSLSHEVKAVT